MKQVAPLRYDVIFKKAFCVPEIFTAFVRDFVGIEIEIDTVEKDKACEPAIGNVVTKFDLYAEDKKNRVIVNIEHEGYLSDYERAIYSHAALLTQKTDNRNLDHPEWKIFTLVVFTSGDKHQSDISITELTPKNLKGEPLEESHYKVIYICPKYLKDDTPEEYREWMEAIEDTLDEQVDESHYTRPEIQRIFKLIEKDKVTPQERAKMFDEYGMEAVKQEKIQKIKEEARKEAIEETARNLLSVGTFTEEQIAQATGLTLEKVKAFKV
jgi:predicted RNA binding protein with dsRBD fold (UPF0201 family)